MKILTVEDHELEFSAYTEGHGAQNEDRVEVFENSTGLIAVVVDGAGGTGGGREAAEFVVERVREYAESLSDAASVVALLHTLDSELLRSPAGECALVVLIIEGGQIQGASVGDCEAWALSESEIEDLTHRQVRKPLLGTGEARATPFSAKMPRSLLIATDGLMNYAPRPQLVDQLRSSRPLQDVLPAMVDASRLRTGELWDDVGVVVFRKTYSDG